MSLNDISERLALWNANVQKSGFNEIARRALTAIQLDFRIVLLRMQPYSKHYDQMSKACLDAMIVLTDPDFNEAMRNDLISQMGDVVRDGRKLEKFYG